MTLLIFVRHGESTFNASGNLEGTPDSELELTELGVQQVLEVAKQLSKYGNKGNKIPSKSYVQIYSSPYKRALETANIIQKELELTGKIVVDTRLSEMNWGLFSGAENDEAGGKNFPEEYEQYLKLEKLVGRRYTRRPFGESPADVENRVTSFIKELLQGHANRLSVKIIVTHGGLMRTLENVLTKEFKEKNPLVFTRDFENCETLTVKPNDFLFWDRG